MNLSILFTRGDIINYIKYLISNLIIIIFTILFITVLNYYNLINDKFYSLIKLLILIISFIVNSYLLGKHYKTKKLEVGLKFGLLNIIVFFIPTIITSNFKLKTLIFYLIILGSSMIGSYFSKNKKIR